MYGGALAESIKIPYEVATRLVIVTRMRSSADHTKSGLFFLAYTSTAQAKRAVIVQWYGKRRE